MPTPPPRRHRPIRLFVIESPAPSDLLGGTAEAPALSAVATLIGHEVATMPVRTRAEFAEACAFVASIGDYGDAAATALPLYVHIAAHGDKEGIGFGHDKAAWADVVADIEPLMTMANYGSPVVIVLSACHAVDQKVTDLISARAQAKSSLRPPAYFFATSSREVAFSDALVSWIVFYHQMASVDLSRRKKVQEVLDRVKDAGAERVTYFRWSETSRSYLRYPRKLKIKAATKRKPRRRKA